MKPVFAGFCGRVTAFLDLSIPILVQRGGQSSGQMLLQTYQGLFWPQCTIFGAGGRSVKQSNRFLWTRQGLIILFLVQEGVQSSGQSEFYERIKASFGHNILLLVYYCQPFLAMIYCCQCTIVSVRRGQSSGQTVCCGRVKTAFGFWPYYIFFSVRGRSVQRSNRILRTRQGLFWL